MLLKRENKLSKNFFWFIEFSFESLNTKIMNYDNFVVNNHFNRQIIFLSWVECLMKMDLIEEIKLR